MTARRLHIALPLMDELDTISEIITAFESQTYTNFDVYICVNQPDKWWSIPEKKEVCVNNLQTLKLLNSLNKEEYIIIDHASEGKGWRNSEGGAGIARKTIMDKIAINAKADDMIVSLDGDTLFGNGYFESLCCNFDVENHDFAALSNPYYHNLTTNDNIDRALLRYEIYLRYFLINMLRIKSPYAFTALGSAIIVPVWAYKAISGISPVKNGEDFYFLQKLAKYRKVKNWNSENVFPSGRLSDRVDFGTGPALKAGINGNWSSYPIFDHTLFDQVRLTYDLFTNLYTADVDTPMSEFLRNQFKSDDLWSPLRNNYNNISRFVHACECKVDGLRIFQFLRSSFDYSKSSDEQRLVTFINEHLNSEIEKLSINLDELSFAKSSVSDLNQLRNFLQNTEIKMRYEHDRR